MYGRVCDKGILSAMVCAANELIETGCRDFGLLFVVGEKRITGRRAHGHGCNLKPAG